MIGEVFERQYLVNDEKLLKPDIAFMVTVEPEDTSGLVHCDKCNRDFISQGFYEAHLRRPEHFQVGIDVVEAPVLKVEEEFPDGAMIDPHTGRLKRK